MEHIFDLKVKTFLFWFDKFLDISIYISFSFLSERIAKLLRLSNFSLNLLCLELAAHCVLSEFNMSKDGGSKCPLGIPWVSLSLRKVDV
jgi:hypothetical protein